MIDWTDHMIVRANPPRVNEPLTGRRYWFSTSTDGLVEGELVVMSAQWVQVKTADGTHTNYRRCNTSVFAERPNITDRLGITRPYYA